MNEDDENRMIMGQKEECKYVKRGVMIKDNNGTIITDVKRGLMIKDNNGTLITDLMQCCVHGEAITNNCS